MVSLSAFNMIDVAKCDRLKRSIAEKKGFTSEVVYHDAYGHYLDNPHESVTREDTTKRPAKCEVYGNNKRLEQELEKSGKQGGIWTTAFTINIEKNAVTNTDIPVSLASCNLKTDMRIEHMVSLEKMPKSCKLESVHGHNIRDKNPAFHIHLKCDDTSPETIEFLISVLDESDRVGWKMCKGVSREALEGMF